MSNKRSDEQKILFDAYVYVSTIQRYFSLSKLYAEDVFVKAQELDERSGYIKIYEDRVRTEAVFEVLGLELETLLSRYRLKMDIKKSDLHQQTTK